jgi:hypothetical protein
MYLPKRAKFIPRRAKTTHLTVMLEERWWQLKEFLLNKE